MTSIKISSLVIPRKNGSVLLGMKKRGFGCGKWNGFGGKIETGESILECAKRELFEECGIIAENLEKIGYLSFEFVENPLIMNVHVFTALKFHGEPCESTEMRPQWFRENEVPFEEMWADDSYWFPLFLKGIKFKGYFKFLDTETIIENKLEEVTNLDS